jgi:hypothetical protein
MVATLEAGGRYPLSKRGASVIWGAALALPRYISYAAYIVFTNLDSFAISHKDAACTYLAGPSLPSFSNTYIHRTQLTIAYARRHKAKYTAIFWINANDQDSLKLSFVDIAQQVLRDHPSDSVLASVDLEGNLDDAVNAVKAWLSIGKNAH